MTLDTTTAVVATAFGGPEVLELRELPLPPPGPDEVVLEVRAAGTNPIDYKGYSGSFGRPELPLRLGREAAGVVVGSGSQPKSWLGREAIVYPASGTYATHVVVPASNLVEKPPALGFEEAAGLLLAGVTAVHALAVVEAGQGDTVLVHGAAGGVGLLAIQLAVLRGARVIGTASPGSHALLRELGAEPVDYGDGLAERVRGLAPDGIDVAVDAAGGDEPLDTSLELVADRGRIVTMVAAPRAFELGVRVIGGAPGADAGTEIRRSARPQLARLAADGRLRVVVAGSYPLSEAAEAHRRLAGRHTHGKLVLTP
jgi:NADPH:quinone reductase-like Zn-dependent oxidoreductase